MDPALAAACDLGEAYGGDAGEEEEEQEEQEGMEGGAAETEVGPAARAVHAIVEKLRVALGDAGRSAVVSMET